MNLLKKLLHYTTQLLVNSLDSKLKNQESSLEDSFTSFYIWELSLSIHVWEWGPSFEFLDPGIHPQFPGNNLILENRTIIKDFLVKSGYLHVTCKNTISLFITYHRGNRFCWPCLFFMKTVVRTLKPKPTKHKQAQNKQTNKYQIWSSITHNNWAGMPA